jgi:hypothetical protein
MTAPDDGPSRRKGRRLNEQERTLWKAVATSITPLRRRTVKASEPDEPQIVRAPKAAEPAPPARTRSSLMKTAAPVLKPPAPPSLEPLERRDRKRIARGRIAIDARIDLHGRTQAEAYDALLAFIRGAHGSRDHGQGQHRRRRRARCAQAAGADVARLAGAADLHPRRRDGVARARRRGRALRSPAPRSQRAYCVIASN